MVSLFLLAQQIYHQQWYRTCCHSCKFMTFALNCRTMSRPPSCTFCTLFCYIFTLFSLLKTNPSSIKWMLQQALIKHIFFFIISQFCCLGHSERWLLAGCLIKTKIQSEMDVSPLHKLLQSKKTDSSGLEIDRQIDRQIPPQNA